jgi:hypothetical protein
VPDQRNGTIARAVSTFETDFREFNGRAPTPEETRQHLAFDRLAKSSSLDPATLLLIVDAGRRGGDDDDRAGQLGRIEALLRRNAKTAGERVIAYPTRDLVVSAITVACVSSWPSWRAPPQYRPWRSSQPSRWEWPPRLRTCTWRRLSVIPDDGR